MSQLIFDQNCTSVIHTGFKHQTYCWYITSNSPSANCLYDMDNFKHKIFPFIIKCICNMSLIMHIYFRII